MKKSILPGSTIPSYSDAFLTEGIEGLTFLDLKQGAEKFLSISYWFSSLEIAYDNPTLKEGMGFLKHSFRFFADKYKEEYAFHAPIILICPESHQLQLKFSMRLKKDIREQA